MVSRHCGQRIHGLVVSTYGRLQDRECIVSFLHARHRRCTVAFRIARIHRHCLQAKLFLIFRIFVRWPGHVSVRHGRRRTHMIHRNFLIIKFLLVIRYIVIVLVLVDFRFLWTARDRYPSLNDIEEFILIGRTNASILSNKQVFLVNTWTLF